MTHPTKDHKNEPLWDFRNVTVDHKGEANFFSISSCQPTQICARGLGAREQGVVLAMSCISSCPPILLDFVTGSIMSYTRRRTESAWGQAESALRMQMTPTFAHVGALHTWAHCAECASSTCNCLVNVHSCLRIARVTTAGAFRARPRSGTRRWSVLRSTPLRRPVPR